MAGMAVKLRAKFECFTASVKEIMKRERKSSSFPLKPKKEKGNNGDNNYEIDTYMRKNTTKK